MTGGRLKRVAAVSRRRDVLPHLRRRGRRRRHRRADRVPPRRRARLATVTAVQPPGRFGALELERRARSRASREKPRGDGAWINGGFFVLEPACATTSPATTRCGSEEPLRAASPSDGQLAVYRHDGFWQPMDTLRERNAARGAVGRPARRRGGHGPDRGAACRFCGAPLEHVFADLGMSPLANAYLRARARERDGAVLSAARARLRRVLPRAAAGSSRRRRRSSPTTPTSRRTRRAGSSTARRYAEEMIERLGLGADSQVVELACNDGYLLQYFVERGRAGARHRAGRERRRGRASRRASRRSSSSSASRRRERARRGRGRRPTCCSATTCSRTCPTSTTSSPG